MHAAGYHLYCGLTHITLRYPTLTFALGRIFLYIYVQLYIQTLVCMPSQWHDVHDV